MADPRDRQARMATFAIFLVQGICFSALVARIATIQNRFQLSDGELGLVFLVVPVIAGVGSILAGFLATRFGSRPVLRAAQLIVCVAVVAIGLAPTLPALYAGTALFGVTIGAVDATMNMQAVATERRYGRSIINAYFVVWSAAAIAAGLWSSLADGQKWSLLASLAPAALLGAIISLLAGPRLLPREFEAAPAQTRTVRVRIPWRAILPLCLAMGCLYVADAAVSNYSTVYMNKIIHSTEGLWALAYVAYQAATMLARAVSDPAVGRFGAPLVVRAGGIAATLGLVGVVAAQRPFVAILAFGVVGAGLGVIAPQSFAAAGRVDAAAAEVAIATVNLFNYVGFVLGAILVTGIAEAADVRIAFAAPLLLTPVIILLARGFTRRSTQPRERVA